MKKIALALVSVAGLLSTSAMADAYVGAGLGQGHVKLDCSGVQSCDNNGTAAKLFGGFDLGSGFALELTYLNFGKAKATDAGVSLNAKATGIGAGVAHTINFNDSWNLTSRLGVANMKVKIDGTVAGVGNASISESNAKPYFGLALGYNLTKSTRLELSGDFSRAEFEGEDASVRAITIGVRQSF